MRKHLKDYFIPHEGNDYTPHSLQRAAVTGMAALVLITFAATNVLSVLWMSSDWLVGAVLPAVIVELTNDERADEALGNLRRNSTLDAAASLKAQHMAANEYFAHFAPDGTSPWYFFSQADYNFVHAGENLAIHFNDSGDVVDAWMDSPTHRANILNGNYTEIGIGVAEGEFEGHDTLYVVQLFGTPAATPAVAAAATETPEPVEVAVAETPDDESEVLAESVAITETVETVPAEPEPVIITTITEPEPTEPTPPTSTEEVADPAPSDVVITEATTDTIYSDFISTSTGGVPATVAADPNPPVESPSLVSELATQPHMVLQVLYGLIAFFVIGALLLSILIEWREQQPIQLAYSVALLLLMYVLYETHIYLTGGATIV